MRVNVGILTIVYTFFNPCCNIISIFPKSPKNTFLFFKNNFFVINSRTILNCDTFVCGAIYNQWQFKWRRYTQHNDIQYDDILHNNTEHNVDQHNSK